jgi:hypothetical protein
MRRHGPRRAPPAAVNLRLRLLSSRPRPRVERFTVRFRPPESGVTEGRQTAKASLVVDRLARLPVRSAPVLSPLLARGPPSRTPTPGGALAPASSNLHAAAAAAAAAPRPRHLGNRLTLLVPLSTPRTPSTAWSSSGNRPFDSGSYDSRPLP